MYPVYLCYFYEGKKLRQSTNIMSMKKDWNQQANHGIGELRASYGPDYRKKNQLLQKKLRKVDTCIFEYVEQNSRINADVIKGFMSGDNRPLRTDKGQTFEAYAIELLKKQYARRKIRVSTYKNSITVINQFIKYLNDMELYNKSKVFIGDMTEDVVWGFLSWGLEHGRKTGTVEKYQEVISKICRQASDEGLLSKASVQAISDIVLEKSIDEKSGRCIKYLTTEELQKIILVKNNLSSDKLADTLEIFLFALLACGLRISDIITLRWCDIDFEKKELDKIQVKTRGRNIIPLTDEALEILRKWQGRHDVFVFGLLPDDFNLKDEERLRCRRNCITSTINKSLGSISKKAGLSKIVTFHMARHTWAVNALEQGMTMNMISTLMGHSSSDITARVYAQFTQSTKAVEVGKLKFNFRLKKSITTNLLIQ